MTPATGGGRVSGDNGRDTVALRRGDDAFFDNDNETSKWRHIFEHYFANFEEVRGIVTS